MGAKILQSGDLDQRVKLLEPTETNVSGQLIVTYAENTEVWAHVISQRGWEAFEAARTNAKEAVRIGMRWNADINTKWLVEWLGQRYAVLNVDRSCVRDGFIWITAQVSGAE